MATTTPRFGWPVPTSTDLVTNGADAIQALGDAIDSRFGSATFPNQVVNVSSGIARPIAFSMRSGRAAAVAAGSSATITFPANRFTVAPQLLVSFDSNSTTLSGPCGGNTSSATAGNVTNSATGGRDIWWLAIQMTSTAALG